MEVFDGMEFNEIEQEENDIETVIGNFDISMPSEKFTCREEPGFFDLGGMLVVSCYTKVVVEHRDGTIEEIAPIVVESCMNPGKKEIVPVTFFIEDGWEIYRISNTYKQIAFYDLKEYKKIYTMPYEPKIEKHSCSECTNCGRC